MSAQVKSKKRVAEHGEVFTNEREVNAMLDLVANECLRPDSRFLEPACGDGNFLAAILKRKLAELRRKYKKSPRDYEKQAIVAIGSLYGVDIMNDNVEACRERLYAIWDEEYTNHCKTEASDEARQAAQFIISRNIINGNALTLMCVDADGNDTSTPIVLKAIIAALAVISFSLLREKLFVPVSAQTPILNSTLAPDTFKMSSPISFAVPTKA